MSSGPWNKFVKLAARAFYDDITMKNDNQPKTGRSDNRGVAVIVLDALSRRQWIREEDLAKALKLHTKQLRRILRFFEEEKLVTRDHRKESAKGAKVFTAAVAATANGQQAVKEGEEKTKMHTHSYCCLDYAQIYDVVRYRVHRMKKKLKDELDNRNTIQQYICPNCSRRYSAFDALQLFSPNDEYFHCENCNGELVAESDKLAAEEMGEGDDNARRRHREKLKDMLQKMEEQLKPLTQQLVRVKDLAIPDFGTLQAWEARVHAATRANGDNNANDSSRTSQGHGGTHISLGDTMFHVSFDGKEAKPETDAKDTSQKQFPRWMRKEGMNLTAVQLGEVKHELDADQISQPADEKKPKDEAEDQKSIQDEYVKAYYAALAKMQEEQQKNMASTSDVQSEYSEAWAERQVGEKAKKGDDDGDNDDVEWEEASPADDTSKTFKVADLNVQADESEDEDDEIDWEEG